MQLPLSPGDLLKLASYFSREEGTCLLYSGGEYDSAERSFLFLFPFETITVNDRDWDALKQIKLSQDWVGFVGYEMGASSDPKKRLPLPKASTPDAYFQRCAVKIELDHQKNRASISTIAGKEGIEPFLSKEAFQKLLQTLPDIEGTHQATLVHPPTTLDQYTEKIREAKELIWNGDIYQVNLSHQMDFGTEGDPFFVFHRLVKKNPTPFSAYFHLKGLTIVSSSPERLLQKRGNRLETRPIKGTIARGKTPEEDLQNRSQLLASSKDHAELLMITDLMRNDLGKVSLPGTVVTEKLITCEAYAHVFHLLSVIRSQCANIHPVDILRACFPGGSVTGCPKLRAMEAIEQLEKRPRGIYTGSIGYFAANGDFDFNIAIRTLVFAAGQATLQVGGAVVADSEAESEYQETLIKADALLEALGFKKIT